MSITDLLALRPASGGPSTYRRARLALAAWRQRRALADLPAERLSDLGLTEDDVRRETSRPMWDVPQHWLR
ncbi:MAG: DUF1127 domain-containing protein [Rhodobacteraceae bacterium]|jgi:uncharacterized protein YjiS (DUF1127 family)|nr:DUF1127 domain-containing protein [Paracoccaceae bacterium]